MDPNQEPQQGHSADVDFAGPTAPDHLPTPSGADDLPGGDPVPRPGVNRFAIASPVLILLSATLPLLLPPSRIIAVPALVASLLALLFGIVALIQIRSRRQRGRGLAIAGLVLSGAWLVLVSYVFFRFVQESNEPERDSQGQVNHSGYAYLADLRAGDCVDNFDGSGTFHKMKVVPCGQSHDAEVIVVFELSAGPWPGEHSVGQETARGCSGRLKLALSNSPMRDSLAEHHLFPSSSVGWNDSRQVACLVSNPSNKLIGQVPR